jgi:hypothetical protein
VSWKYLSNIGEDPKSGLDFRMGKAGIGALTERVSREIWVKAV